MVLEIGEASLAALVLGGVGVEGDAVAFPIRVTLLEGLAHGSEVLAIGADAQAVLVLQVVDAEVGMPMKWNSEQVM